MTVLAILAFALVVGTAVVWFRAMGRVAIPRNRFVFVAAWALGVSLGLVALASGRTGWLGGTFALLAIVLGGFPLFTVAISRQKAEGAIGPGDLLPAFRAPNDSGGIFDSTTLAGRRVLLKFFRGHW